MRPWVRIANAVLGALSIVLLALHGLGEALVLMGVGLYFPAVLSRALFAVVLCHATIGVVLTAHDLKAARASGASYTRLARRLWTSRLSGIAIALLVVAHVLQFAHGSGAVRLRPFGVAPYVLALLLVASLAVHILTNARPLAISLGLPVPRERAADIAFVLSCVLVAAAVGFCIYFVRWSVI